MVTQHEYFDVGDAYAVGCTIKKHKCKCCCNRKAELPRNKNVMIFAIKLVIALR